MNKTPVNNVDSLGWSQNQLIDPHGEESKAKRVNAMFSAIADSYDLNNRLHSLWRDQAWRKKGVKLTKVKAGQDQVLDVACGTGDLTMAFADCTPASVTGIDFVPRMIEIAKWKTDNKLKRSDNPRELTGTNTHHSTSVGTVTNNKWTTPTFIVGDAMDLPMPDSSVDIVSIAFGIRNVSDPAMALSEFRRVLKPGGRLLILEFGLPRNIVLRSAYNFYFNHIMPRTATWISRDRTGAYRYLPRSVTTFIAPDKMQEMILSMGFSDVKIHRLTFGICLAYLGHV